MHTIVPYPYSDADQYAKPVVSQPMPKDVFMTHIREAVEKVYIRTRAMLSNHRMYANILGHYLNKYGIEEVCPDESFIEQMWDRLKESGQFDGREYEWLTRKKVPRFTRKVINECFSPNGLVQRTVLKEIVIGRYERFFKFTKNSQEAIKWFEQNGKRVEAMSVLVQNGETEINPYNEIIRSIHRITNRELLPLTKNGKIEHAIRFLEYVNKNGFEEATKEDVQKFEEVCTERGIKQIEDYLAHVATFFINIHAKGFIKSNPFAHVSLKMNGGAVKKDFVTVEGMEKLRDLTTVDQKNRDDVRDRLFALLAYDLALRIGELLALEVSDFKKDAQGEWFVLLRAEVQKGYKDEEVMYFFFDETKELLELYLNKIRDQYKPTTNHLILSNQWGRSISTTACATRFRQLCKRLNIKTYYGGSPSPHLLRHSFATLNIEPIGLALPLYEMIQRLRHTRVETTRKHYIHNNPYLKKIKHDVLRKNNKKKTATDVLNEMSLADLEHWFSDKLGMDSATVRHIRENHKKAFEVVIQNPQDEKDDVDNKMFLSEQDALDRIKDLKIPELALRNYALKKKALSKGFIGSARKGKGFRYREDFVEDLARNWTLAENVRQKLNMHPRRFQRTLKQEKWRNLKIGNVLYINKLDCI